VSTGAGAEKTAAAGAGAAEDEPAAAARVEPAAAASGGDAAAGVDRRASVYVGIGATDDVPMTLAALHRTMAVGEVLELTVDGGDHQLVDDLLVGAGFTVDGPVVAGAESGRLVTRAVRARTLPDTVGSGMRLLVCGLNPSVYAADAGVGFARPGNRFWPAALAAGLVSTDRSPDLALADHGVGMTDIVKRATVAAAELTADEYRAGLERVERLVARLRPGVVCFVGLAGWRAVVDRRATAGVQPAGLAGVPVYVMPSTSGLNARTPLAELTEHFRTAMTVARGPAHPMGDLRQ
jgi:TDG/mug DNA glycosylase family protein